MSKTRNLTPDDPCQRCHHEFDEHIGGGSCSTESCRCRSYQEPRPGHASDLGSGSASFDPCSRCGHEFLSHDALTDGHCTMLGCRCRSYKGMRRR